ncbi:AraC family transcriptional regulator [Xanthobacter autotrophicus DSM 431]|uniref:helix-turn-helix transcriptional regulator n=1 Tax=Xanthobacter nonsaccharivorans TaxID=3119912 RepID=UPI00372C235F
MRSHKRHRAETAGASGADPLPDGRGDLVHCAEIAGLSHLAGTHFAVTVPRALGDGAVLAGRYIMTELLSGAVLHATDARDLHDLTSQVVHGEGITFSLFLDGTADVLSGGRAFRFGSGRAGEAEAALMVRTEPDLFVRRGRQGHHVRKVNVTVPAFWLEESGLDQVDRHRAAWHFSREHLSNLRWRPSARLVALAEQVLATPAYGPLLRRLYLESRTTEMLFEAFSTLAEGAGSADRHRPRLRQRMRQVQDFLEDRLDAPLTLETVAQEAGMSITSLQRAFRDAFGTTVFDYVRRRKLERARDALRSEGVSVTEAAAIAGYTSGANFSTAFKRAFGVSPKSVR